MGELARKPGCPELPKTPLELLTLRPGEGFTDVDRVMWPFAGGIAGLVTSSFMNSLRMRPMWSGIPLHIICCAIGTGAAIVLRDIHFASQAEAQAVMKHYITLHPEDFPPYERKRWSDLYIPFKPIR